VCQWHAFFALTTIIGFKNQLYGKKKFLQASPEKDITMIPAGTFAEGQNS